MQATGPGSGKSRGARISSAWLAWMVDVVGDAVEPGPLDRDAAVAGAVGQLVEQLGQVGGGRLRQPAEDAGVAVHQVDLAFDLRPAVAGEEAAVARHDVVGQAPATRAAVQLRQERAARQHVLRGLAQPVGEVHHRLRRLLAR